MVQPVLYKIIFLLAAIHNWEIKHMDIKTAFLYSKIDEKVYVEQPTGFTKEKSSMPPQKNTIQSQTIALNLVHQDCNLFN